MKTRITMPLIGLLAASPLALAAPPDTAAVEFYNRYLDHYFVTATSSEALGIDAGHAGPGWERTGRSFPAWLTKAGAPADAQPVCRFYSSGANSHFYTASASECAGLKAIQASANAAAGAFNGWRYEGTAFYIQAPTDGACPAGTAALTRAYNRGFATGAGSNHRLVDDASLAQLMADQSWVVEGVTMCAPAKSTGGITPLHASASFASLVGTWEGTAKWQAETAGTETRTLAPLSLTVAEDGTLAGTGAGCTFAGAMQMGDGFRAHFVGTATATGCTDPAFDGTYDRVHFERLGSWGVHVHMKREDASGEATISAILDDNADTPPATTLAGDWTGTVGWKTETATQGDDETEVKVNQDLTLSIAETGEVTGSGYGCTFTGTVSQQLALGRHGLRTTIFVGDITAAGCTEPLFDGTYEHARFVADGPGRLEVKLERESDDGTTSTEVKIEGDLTPAT